MTVHEIDPIERYVETFKALSDMTRLKIMWLLLSVDSKIYVSEIIDVLGENQYNVSKHLRILKGAGLVYERKEGKWTSYHYRPGRDEFDAEIRQTILAIPKELMAREIAACQKRLAMRVDGRCVLGTESDEWAEAMRVLV